MIVQVFVKTLSRMSHYFNGLYTAELSMVLNFHTSVCLVVKVGAANMWPFDI